MKKLIALAAFVLAIATAASAQVPAGSGTLAGGDRLKVEGCGKDSGAISVAFTLGGNGTWTANVAGDVYGGSSTTSGRVTSLTFDAASQSLLDSALEEAASDLCEDDVTINSLTLTQAKLKVSKRGDRAKLQVKARGTGVSSEGSGNGKYRLKATGTWQALVP